MYFFLVIYPYRVEAMINDSSYIIWPSSFGRMQIWAVKKTVLAKNDRRLIFIQSPAAFIFCRVKSDIKFARSRSIHLYLFVCQRWAS